MSELFRKLGWLTRRSRKEIELQEELEFHLREDAAEREAAGLNEDEAIRAARRKLGNVTLCMEETRAMWGWTSLEQLWQDLRYSARMLRKTPGFTAAAVLSLALGIGANTAIFSLLNAIVLRLLPVKNPQQIVQLTYTYTDTTGANNWNSYFGYPQFDRFRAQSKTLSGVFGGVGMGRINLIHHGAAGLAQGDVYTASLFSVLGVTPQYGRFFSESEDREGAAVVVLNDRYWRSRFGADPSIIGAGVTINEIPFTVIGVAPQGFSGIYLGRGPDVWAPLHALDRLQAVKLSPPIVTGMANRRRWTESFTSWMLIAGRLRPGVSRAEAQSELDVIYRQLLAEQLAGSEQRGSESTQRFVRESHLVLHPAATGAPSGTRASYEFPLKLLMGVAGIVLLVACANVANLLLARASNRRREIATRMALGAARSRVVRQLLTESVLLASIGGTLAIAIAWWGSVALVRMISTGDSPPTLDVHPDWRIFGFTAAVSMATGILFGLAPALRGTRVDAGQAMKEGARLSGRSSHALDRLLVVAQVALSVVLITGAGLFVRTLQRLWSVEMGFDRENVLMFSLDAKLAGYPNNRAGAVYREILERMQALPEAQSASASIVRPVDDQFYLVDRIGEVDGRKLPERDTIRVAWNALSPGYFSTVQTPILLGRDFNFSDNESGATVAIVNESLAARAFPGQNPIGHRLGPAAIVGVVKDSHYNGVRDQPRPVLYHPLFQRGRDTGHQEFRWGFVSYELRYRTSANLVDAVRREVSSVDRNLPIFRIKTLRAQAEESLLKERLLAMVSSFFGALAVALACVGLYGLMAYAVARRTSEIGIRLALGARRDHILWLVLRETIWLTVAGVVVGVPAALWAAKFAKSLLFGIEVADPVTIVGSIATLMSVAALAGYLPARRAMQVDPMMALRYE